MQYVLSTAQILSATVKYVLMKKKENLNFLFTLPPLRNSLKKNSQKGR